MRGHVLPAATKEDEFRFGIGTKRSDDAKQLIYAPTPTPPTATAEEKTATTVTAGYYGTHRQASTKALTRAGGAADHAARSTATTTGPAASPSRQPSDTFTFGLPPPPSETQQVKRALTFEPEEKETVVISSKGGRPR